MQVCKGRPGMGQPQHRQQAGRAGLPRGGANAEAEEEDRAAEAAQQRARAAPTQPAGGGAWAEEAWARNGCEERSSSACKGRREEAGSQGQACWTKETLM